MKFNSIMDTKIFNLIRDPTKLSEGALSIILVGPVFICSKLHILLKNNLDGHLGNKDSVVNICESIEEINIAIKVHYIILISDGTNRVRQMTDNISRIDDTFFVNKKVMFVLAMEAPHKCADRMVDFMLEESESSKSYYLCTKRDEEGLLDLSKRILELIKYTELD